MERHIFYTNLVKKKDFKQCEVFNNAKIQTFLKTN